MIRSYFIILIFLLDFQTGVAQQLENFKYKGKNIQPLSNVVLRENQFNGYTNHWQDTYHHWLRYGNLFKMAISDVEKTMMQSKVDIAEDLGIPGLLMQEGFIDGLISDQFIVLDKPSVEDLESNLKNSNLLVFVDPGSDVGKTVHSRLPENRWPGLLKSHQYGDLDMGLAHAFYLQDGTNRLFVVSSKEEDTRNQIRTQINRTIEVPITFIGAFPVDQPLFLHMFLNDPGNKASHYYYAEFQPWVPIFQRSTIYFSYYIWGSGGPWERGVQALRERNLITRRDNRH